MTTVKDIYDYKNLPPSFIDHTTINERGNKIMYLVTSRGADRYYYDCKACKPENGWKQYDTDQDAPYFGIWVNSEKRVTVTYAEGDESIVECHSEESFKAELKSMAEFYGPPPPAFIVIAADGARTDVYDERPTGETKTE